MNSEVPHKPWKDSLFTLATSGAVIALSMFVAGFLSRMLPTSQFEDYLFIRRFIAIVFPIMTISAGTGLTWFLASSQDESDRAKALKGTLFIVFLVNILFFIAVVLIPGIIFKSYFFPVAGDLDILRMATFFWLIAYSGYVLLFSALRGNIRMADANMLNLTVNGLIPAASLLCLYFFHKLSVESFLFVSGTGYFLCYFRIFVLAPHCFSDVKESLMLSFKTVISYSIPRVPAGFLLSFPAYIVPFFLMKSGLDSVSFLSAFMLLQTATYLTDPLGQVFLPSSAKLSGEKDFEKLSTMTSDLVSVSLHLGLIFTVQLFILSDELIRLWFGSSIPAETGGIARILSFSLIPVLLYTPLRSILDGIEKKPLITHILTAGSIFCLIFCVFLTKSGHMSSSGGAYAIVASNILICILLYAATSSKIRIKISLGELVVPGIVSIITGGITILLLTSLLSDWRKSLSQTLLIVAISIILNGIAMFVWLRFRAPKWWKSIRDEFSK